MNTHDIIHTHLFTSDAEKLLRAYFESGVSTFGIRGFCTRSGICILPLKGKDRSSGISLKDSHYHAQMFMSFGVTRAPDGEVLVVKNNADITQVFARAKKFWERPNAARLKWIAGCLSSHIYFWTKTANKENAMSYEDYEAKVKSTSNYKLAWNQCDGCKVHLGFSSKTHVFADLDDLRFLRDFFGQKSGIKDKHQEATVKKLIGTPNDHATTVLETSKQEKVNTLQEAHAEQVKQLLAKEAAEENALNQKWYKIKNDWANETYAMHESHRKETWALQDMQEQEMAALKKSL